MPSARHFLLILIFWTAAAGCALHRDPLGDARVAFRAGRLEQAEQILDRAWKPAGNDADVLQLELAIVKLAAGQPRIAEQNLRDVRDHFDHLEQTSVAENTLSLLTDDNQRAYHGEDYEKVLVRAFLTLANLMHDGGDAIAYSLQTEAKQQELTERVSFEPGEDSEQRHPFVALGPYLRGMLREETHSDYDDAVRCYERVVSWEPTFRAGMDDLSRVRNGHHSAPGHGVLYIFALVGQGPYKREALEVPSSAALLIADRILSATGKYTLPPTVAPIKVPQLVLANNRIDRVQVAVDGQWVGATQTITDVGQLAIQQYDADYDRVVARAIVRRVIKKGIVLAGKDATNVVRGTLANLMWDLGGVAWEALERADTRCWGLLPGTIQVLRIELPANDYQLQLTAAHGNAPLGPGASHRVRIYNGRNTYLLANFPVDRAVGKILAR